MGNIYRFPEPSQNSNDAVRERRGPGELVSIRDGGLEATLEMVGFLRSLANQSYLDRFNRAQPTMRDAHSDDAPQSVPDERR
jgi:hypothetical protein